MTTRNFDALFKPKAVTLVGASNEPNSVGGSRDDFTHARCQTARRLSRSAAVGVSRIVADPENERAEFAVMVRSDMKGRGLGFQLMKDILACARKRGTNIVHGEVLAENTTMLQMASELGFTRDREESGVVSVSICL